MNICRNAEKRLVGNGLENCFDLRFELPEINTWRLFAKAINQQDIISMVEAWEIHGYRFGCVCIDDGWSVDGKLGEWIPDPARFPDFAGLIKWIHQKGYAVRLWVAPLQAHPGTPIYSALFPDGMLKNKYQKPAFYRGLGTYRLDPRIPEAQGHIRATMQRLIRDYHVDAFKVDFPPFYIPHDEFYREHEFEFTDHDNKTMVSEFYRLVRESIDSVNPAVRIECARDLPGCQAYINDTICGDLVGQSRTLSQLAEITARLRTYSAGHAIVPWLEMIWGEGGDMPHPGVEWHAGCLEYMALSVNFGLKLEHSFWPFRYPNSDQMRCLSNLYGPRDPRCKVLSAGRQSWIVAELQTAGITVDADTRFLVLPETSRTVTLHTGCLGTNALQWCARDVLANQPVRLIARNEFWGDGLDGCFVQFQADARGVYELWHEGTRDDYFLRLWAEHGSKR